MSAPQPAVTARNERINRRLHERVPIESSSSPVGKTVRETMSSAHGLWT